MPCEVRLRVVRSAYALRCKITVTGQQKRTCRSCRRAVQGDDVLVKRLAELLTSQLFLEKMSYYEHAVKA